MLVLGLPVVAHLLRGALDTWVLPSGWYIASFAATLLVARLAGIAAGLASALVAVALVSIDPPGLFSIPTWIRLVPPLPSREVALEMLTVVAGVGLGTVIARVRDVGRPTAAMLDEAVGRRRRAEREVHDLADLARSLDGPSSPRQVADQLARAGAAIAEADAVAVVVFGPARQPPPPGSPVLGSTDAEILAVAGRPDEVERARAVATRLGPDVVAAADRAGEDHAVASVTVPLAGGGSTVGALVLVFAAPRPVSRRTLELLEVAARVGAEGLVRTREAAAGRREQQEAGVAADRVARLQAIARELAPAVDAPTIARSVVDVATDALGARVGLLYRRSTEPDRLELLYGRGYPPGLSRSQATLPIDAVLPATDAVRLRSGLLVAAEEWARRFPGASDIPSIVSLSLVAAEPLGDDPVRGALVVGWGGEVTIGAPERRFLAALAAQASAALARADLIDALRDRQRRLDATLEVASAGAWDLDLERDQLELSPEFLRIRGRPAVADAGGLDAYLSLVHPDDRMRVRATIDEAARTLGPFAAEFQAPPPRAAPPGTPVQWIRSEGWVSAEGPGGRRRLTGIDRDVTAERHVEEAREQELESERDARALQDAFIGVMSHELRTPITTILAASRLLLRGNRSAEATRELGNDIASEAERLHRLVDDLLVMSRIERGSLVPEREPVHIRRLIERVVRNEAGRWPETRFVLAGPPRGDVVAGEETYVEQVLRNLLTNAAKYAGRGTTVTVEVDGTRDEVAVRVLDEGPGVAAAEVDDLFALFYRSATTAAAASGAGIGLFVCSRLVRAMHGRIWARPRPTRGSEFGFALARYRDEDDPDDDFPDDTSADDPVGGDETPVSAAEPAPPVATETPSRRARHRDAPARQARTGRLSDD